MAFGSVVLWLLVVLMGLQIGAGRYSEPHVAGAIDLAHAARADWGDDLVRADFAARC
jgi:hypothetical protein